MSVGEGLAACVEECLQPMGKLTTRSMMGGKTLYLDGTVFAIIADDELWFKADKVSDAQWDAIGAERFTYDMGGKFGTMNYRRAPLDAYDDSDTMRRWAALAVEAGLRAPKKRSRR